MAEILSALIGLGAGFLGGIWQSWMAKRNKLDETLTSERKLLYVELWLLTGRLPKYPKDEKFSAKNAYQLMEELRDWYFGKLGGLYMSADTQKRYIAFQRALDAASKFTDSSSTDWGKLYDAAQDGGSALRTGMTRDLQSRNAANIF